MFTIPRWKVYAIIIVCLVSIYLSIPTLWPGLANSSFQNFFPSNKVNLGLDLSGGASLLLEVDTKRYINDYVEQSISQIKSKLKSENIAIKSIKHDGIRIIIEPGPGASVKRLRSAIHELLSNSVEITSDENNIVISMAKTMTAGMRNNLMEQTLEIIRRRVDETGTRELDIQIQGDNQILLQVPGLQDPGQIKNILGKTAKLTFHLVDDSADVGDALGGKAPKGSMLLPLDGMEDERDIARRVILVKSRAVLGGEMLADAKVSVNDGTPVVVFKLTNVGGKIFADLTSKNTRKHLAIVLDGKVLSAPVINEPILGGNGVISGHFTIQSANELALLLRAGALPAPVHVIEERTVGPSLGADSIEAGKHAMVAGVIMVMLIMLLCYGMFGMVANIALIVNLCMILAVLSLFDATLTLPGIAGMVLTLGMAVDANVLIFERVKEELRKGKNALSSLESGYNMAFNTIFDSNITTIIAALILYIFGTGPIRGVAVTLSVGIICSMFTAVSLTKLIIAKWYRYKRPKSLMI